MRILFDGLLTPKPRSGIERYFTMLTTHYPKDVQVACSCIRDRGGLAIGSHEITTPPFPLFRPRRLAGFLNNICWFGKSFDVVHWMQYGPSQIAKRTFGNGIPYVLTVHDLIHEIYGSPPGLLDREARQASYDHASAILCVSSNTRDDLCNEYDVDTNKLHVVYHGSTLQPTLEEIEAYQNKEQYFLYVGARSGYKNFSAIYLGLKAVFESHPDVKLRIVGSPLTPDEKIALSKYGLSRMVVEEGPVDDAQLAKLYMGCLALLHPSLHEGFGIPLVEAMACGTVPIATYSTCVPEVLENAGIHINTENVPKGFRDAMLQLLSDPDYRSQKAKECYRRSKAFNWETTARNTLEVYKIALGK